MGWGQSLEVKAGQKTQGPVHSPEKIFIEKEDRGQWPTWPLEEPPEPRVGMMPKSWGDGRSL